MRPVQRALNTPCDPFSSIQASGSLSGSRPIVPGPGGVLRMTLEGTLAVSGQRVEQVDGVGDGLHRHPEGQLTWVSSGVQRVWTDAGVWVTPPHYAVWIAGGVMHDSAKWGKGIMHRIKLDPETSKRLPNRCCAVQLTSELRQAILHITAARTLATAQPSDPPILAQLLVEVRDAMVAPLQVPLEAEGNLQPVVSLLLHRPSDQRPPEYWAKFLGISSRTLTRQFQRELGMSFCEFRKQARLLHSLHGLADGNAVATIAQQAGYRSVSMFIQTFRKALGVAPGHYFSARE